MTPSLVAKPEALPAWRMFCGARHCEISSASPLAFDQLHNVLDVNATGDEFRAGSAHHEERLLALVVDEGHVTEVHDTPARVAPLVRALPSGFEFRNPRRDETALQSPTLFRRAFANRDPQHCCFSRRGKSAYAMPIRGEVVLCRKRLWEWEIKEAREISGRRVPMRSCRSRGTCANPVAAG